MTDAPVTLEEELTAGGQLVQGTLAAALIQFQKNAPFIKLDSVNPHFHSKYASLAGIMDAVRGPLAACGLAISQEPGYAIGADGTLVHTLTTRLIHESGEVRESTMALTVDRPGPQAHGSALTYGRRYAALAAVGLVGDEDDDANAAEAPKTKPQKAAATPGATMEKKSGSDLTQAQKRLYAAFKKAETTGTVTAEQFKARLEDYDTRLGGLTDEQVPELIAWLDAEGVPL